MDHWLRDHGKTDIENGILLCRYHHMLIHTKGWEINRQPRNPSGPGDPGGSGDPGGPGDPGGGTYWLKPPKTLDPHQRSIQMPSNNPLVAAMKHAETA
ncbi:MAG TPA: hypothetical protein VHX87_02105 [Galbitalea sp.]|nr:hypothetical protein [Galbitalea sp.]